MFASMLGFILSLVIFIFIIAALIGSAISSASSDETVIVDKESILHITFKQPLQDRSSDNPFENFDFTSFKASSQPGINDIIKTIHKAASDPNINGIYLDLAGLSGGLAS